MGSGRQQWAVAGSGGQQWLANRCRVQLCAVPSQMCTLGGAAPEKTTKEVEAAITKRSKKGGSWFEDICKKLKEKYGADPADMELPEEPRKEKKDKAEKKEKPEKKEKKEKKEKPEKKEKKETPESKEKKDKDSGKSVQTTTAAATAHATHAHARTHEHWLTVCASVVVQALPYRDILINYYAKYDAEKTEADVDAIMEKRMSRGPIEEWFPEMCQKLKVKYGEDPRKLWKAAKKTDSKKADAEPAADEPVEKEADKQAEPPIEEPATPRDLLLSRLSAAADGVDDLAALEEMVAALESSSSTYVAAHAEQKAADDAEKAKLAEEEAKKKDEKKKAARERADKLKAENAAKRAAEEAAEEAAFALEDYEPIDIDDESQLIVLDSEVVAWLEELRLQDYAPVVAVSLLDPPPPHTHTPHTHTPPHPPTHTAPHTIAVRTKRAAGSDVAACCRPSVAHWIRSSAGSRSANTRSCANQLRTPVAHQLQTDLTAVKPGRIPASGCVLYLQFINMLSA